MLAIVERGVAHHVAGLRTAQGHRFEAFPAQIFDRRCRGAEQQVADRSVRIRLTSSGILRLKLRRPAFTCAPEMQLSRGKGARKRGVRIAVEP
jgi:hypothetical protein